jgi:hypothetical protein
MALFGIWADFGFRSNPYSNANLPGDAVGHRLLVGRDSAGPHSATVVILRPNAGARPSWRAAPWRKGSPQNGGTNMLSERSSLA